MLDKKGKILLGIDTNYIWGGVRVRVKNSVIARCTRYNII
jgi:hypothetical protein